jgi:uncharacterized membrane protein
MFETEFEKKRRESQGRYILGLFYCNLNDKRLFVPNRWGFGKMDINIAHPTFHKIFIFLIIFLVSIVIISEILFEHKARIKGGSDYSQSPIEIKK